MTEDEYINNDPNFKDKQYVDSDDVDVQFARVKSYIRKLLCFDERYCNYYNCWQCDPHCDVPPNYNHDL